MEKMKIVKISTKGRIVIPARIRKELGLSKGDKLLLDKKNNVIILRTLVKLSRLRGIDRIENATREIERMRIEWDREFDLRECSVSLTLKP